MTTLRKCDKTDGKLAGRVLLSLVLCTGLLGGAGDVHAEDDPTTLRVYWKDGLRLDTSDKNFRLKIGGRIMNDWAWFDTGDIADLDDGTEFRRARLYVSGELYEHVIFKAQYDFAGGDADFKDVYMGLKDIPALGRIQIGHFKEPFSLEELTSSKYITFMERALPNVFSPGRNMGLGFHTALLDNHATLAAGVFRDADDFGNGGENYNFSVRATGTPLANDSDQLIHLGFAFSHRDPDDTVAVADGGAVGADLRYRQRPEAHLADRFVNTGFLSADSVNVFGFEAAGVFGPASVQGEYILADVDSSTSGDPQFDGFYVYGSYFITGESRSYKASSGAFSRVKPNENFLNGDGCGAIEVAVRYSSLDLTDEAVSGGEIDDITVGVNWYLNPNTRVMFNYTNTDVEAAVDEDGNIYQMRFQLDF